MVSSSLQEALQPHLHALREEADRHCRKCRSEVVLLKEAVATVSALLALEEGALEGSSTAEARPKLQKRVYFQTAQCASLGPDSPVAVVSKALRWYEVEEPETLFQRCAQELARLPLRDGRTSDYVTHARSLLEALQVYAQHYRERGPAAKEAVGGSGTSEELETPSLASAEAVSAPPPPPPPGSALSSPTEAEADQAPGRVASTGDKEAFLAEIQQAGESITKMLRRSRPEPSSTHAADQNIGDTRPSEETSSAAAAGASDAPLLQFERASNRWRVERYRAFSEEPLQISICHPRESVYIYRCEKQNIRIRNKCNTVMLDACKNVGLLLDGVVSAVELVRCSRCKLQFNGDVPSISIDNSDSIALLGTPGQVITCCATEVTIVEAVGETDRETALPQQFITRRQAIDQQSASNDSASAFRWITEPLTHSGAE